MDKTLPGTDAKPCLRWTLHSRVPLGLPCCVLGGVYSFLPAVWLQVLLYQKGKGIKPRLTFSLLFDL